MTTLAQGKWQPATDGPFKGLDEADALALVDLWAKLVRALSPSRP